MLFKITRNSAGPMRHTSHLGNLEPFCGAGGCQLAVCQGCGVRRDTTTAARLQLQCAAGRPHPTLGRRPRVQCAGRGAGRWRAAGGPLADRMLCLYVPTCAVTSVLPMADCCEPCTCSGIEQILDSMQLLRRHLFSTCTVVAPLQQGRMDALPLAACLNEPPAPPDTCVGGDTGCHSGAHSDCSDGGSGCWRLAGYTSAEEATHWRQVSLTLHPSVLCMLPSQA